MIWLFSGDMWANGKATEDSALENAMKHYSEGSPTVWSVHTQARKNSPNYLPRTFWWTIGGYNRASRHQATGYRQRAGQAVTSLSFIHLFIQSFLLPTGKALVGMCPQAQAQCLFLVLHFFSNKCRPQGKATLEAAGLETTSQSTAATFASI